MSFTLRKSHAYTLFELMVVLTVIALLAALAFPVFASARQAAYKERCISNFKQGGLASTLYGNDYDDHFMMINQRPVTAKADAKNDRTWVQTVLPYTRTFSIFHCPSDYGRKVKDEEVFDEDIVPGDNYSRYYYASMHSNLGFNYLYLSPVTKVEQQWMPQPRMVSQVASTSQTILFADSVWDLDENGNPFGGGRYIISPPCRYEIRAGQKVDSFQLNPGETQFYTEEVGWDDSDSNRTYGGAWPWHFGRINTISVDGSAHTLSTEALTTGCDLKSHWRGFIVNTGEYLWDLH